MVAVLDNARITYLKAEVKTDLKRPGDNYQDAARVVWLACLRDAEKHGERYDDGWLRKGSLASIIALLWPTLTKSEMHNAGHYISEYLRNTGNVFLMERGYGPKSLSTWYVRSEWNEITGNDRPSKATGRKATGTRPAPKKASVATSPVSDSSEVDSPISRLETIPPVAVEYLRQWSRPQTPQHSIEWEKVDKDAIIATLVDENTRLHRFIDEMRNHLAYLWSRTG